jgi:hypothetical protein
MFAPNTKSWLVKGGWILNGFGAVTTAVLVARWLGYDAAADALRWVNVPVAVMTSGYSAFLFAQCKGRDLWVLGANNVHGPWLLLAVSLSMAALVISDSPKFPGMSFTHGVMPVEALSLAALGLTLAAENKFGHPTGGGGVAWHVAVFALLVYGQFLHDRAWVKEGQRPLIS